MTIRIFVLICASIVCTAFLVMSCGGQATPNPTEIARLADRAARATLTAMFVVTAVPTATVAPPTATPRPATSTATRQPVSIPAGWRTYQLISGEVMVAHPPDWTIASEKENEVAWVAGAYAIAALTNVSQEVALAPSADPETQVRELKKELLNLYATDSMVTFRKTGTLAALNDPVYVVAVVEKGGVKSAVLMTFITDVNHVLRLQIFYAMTETLPPGAVDIMTRFAKTVQFKPFTIPSPVPTPRLKRRQSRWPRLATCAPDWEPIIRLLAVRRWVTKLS